MIELTLRIKHTEEGIESTMNGGDVGLATRMEVDFMKKLIKHIRKFNTTYKRVPSRSRTKIHASRVK